MTPYGNCLESAACCLRMIEKRPKRVQYDDKVACLAEVINTVEPDVLALQEVGPEHVLADLNTACSIDFDNRLAGIPDGRGIRVAVLSPRRYRTE
jgi:hypothetical protein